MRHCLQLASDQCNTTLLQSCANKHTLKIVLNIRRLCLLLFLRGTECAEARGRVLDT